QTSSPQIRRKKRIVVSGTLTAFRREFVSNWRGYSRSTPLFQTRCNSSGGGTLSGRTTRNPRNCASVRYQMLLGSCGSCCFQLLSEDFLAALRSFSVESSHDPPRATCG